MAFKMRSGNSPLFSRVGSSPVKQTEGADLGPDEDYYVKNIEELGLTELLEKEGENLGTKVRGSYTDEEQAAIDELSKRMREFEDNPK